MYIKKYNTILTNIRIFNCVNIFLNFIKFNILIFRIFCILFKILLKKIFNNKIMDLHFNFIIKYLKLYVIYLYWPLTNRRILNIYLLQILSIRPIAANLKFV